MNPTEQQIAIAEATGWKYIEDMTLPSRSFMGAKSVGSAWQRPDGEFGYGDYVPPNYLNNLNAMHEVEKKLTTTQRIQFADILYNSVGKDLLNWSGCYYPCEQPTIDLDTIFQTLHATASQRAEAYLRTINKWKD